MDYTTKNMSALHEIGKAELQSLDGGGILEALYGIGHAMGSAVGNALGAVKDFIQSGSVEANETLMNCI